VCSLLKLHGSRVQGKGAEGERNKKVLVGEEECNICEIDTGYYAFQ